MFNSAMKIISRADDRFVALKVLSKTKNFRQEIANKNDEGMYITYKIRI